MFVVPELETGVAHRAKRLDPQKSMAASAIVFVPCLFWAFIASPTLLEQGTAWIA